MGSRVACSIDDGAMELRQLGRQAMGDLAGITFQASRPPLGRMMNIEPDEDGVPSLALRGDRREGAIEMPWLGRLCSAEP